MKTLNISFKYQSFIITITVAMVTLTHRNREGLHEKPRNTKSIKLLTFVTFIFAKAMTISSSSIPLKRKRKKILLCGKIKTIKGELGYTSVMV